MKEIISTVEEKTKAALELLKTKFSHIVICLFAVTLLSGCVSTIVRQSIVPTIGQQLMDLKKARDAGVISGQEYDAEKTRLLSQKLPPQ